MELGEFRKEPIGPLLGADFVEARLHTDGKAHIDQILALQDHYVGDPGLPNYIIVDPVTLDAHGRFEGICFDEESVQEFVDFLKQGLTDLRSTSP